MTPIIQPRFDNILIRYQIARRPRLLADLQLTVAVIGLAIGLYFFKKYVDGPPYNVPPYDLKGKYAIVTGGNSGIGFEVVK